jgi:hypothetical protein
MSRELLSRMATGEQISSEGDGGDAGFVYEVS